MCDPLDLLQESVVGQVKRAMNRKPSAFGMATSRARLYSFYLLQRMRSRAHEVDVPELKHQKKMSKEAAAAEDRGYVAVARVSQVVVDLVFASESSDRIAGNLSLKISNSQRVYNLWLLAKISVAAAVRAVAEGLKEGVSVGLPTPSEPAQTCIHIAAPKPKSRQAAKELKELDKLRHARSIQVMEDRGVLDLPDSVATFASGEAGDQKAELFNH